MPVGRGVGAPEITTEVVAVYRNLAFGRALDSLDVMLIEENRGMRSILTTVMKSKGITRIREHDNANHALADMMERVPDVVLTQWLLSGSDAETTIRTMRTDAMRPLCFVPVIVLSVQASRGVVADALYAGASTVLRTPVSPKILIERLQWVTEDGRAFAPDGGRYVLQDAGPASDVPGVDPGYGLMDLGMVTGTGPAR